jgi:hypothetical protein
MLDTVSGISIGCISFLKDLRLAEKTTIMVERVFLMWKEEISYWTLLFLTSFAVSEEELSPEIWAYWKINTLWSCLFLWITPKLKRKAFAVSMRRGSRHDLSPFGVRVFRENTRLCRASFAWILSVYFASCLATSLSLSFETQTFLKFSLSLLGSSALSPLPPSPSSFTGSNAYPQGHCRVGTPISAFSHSGQDCN